MFSKAYRTELETNQAVIWWLGEVVEPVHPNDFTLFLALVGQAWKVRLLFEDVKFINETAWNDERDAIIISDGAVDEYDQVYSLVVSVRVDHEDEIRGYVLEPLGLEGGQEIWIGRSSLVDALQRLTDGTLTVAWSGSHIRRSKAIKE